MKNLRSLFILIISILFTTQSCTNTQQKNQDSVFLIEENISFAAEQYGLMLDKVEDSARIVNPKSFIEGKMKYIRPQEWTSGFFPGSLWYIYELTGDEKWKTMVLTETENAVISVN